MLVHLPDYFPVLSDPGRDLPYGAKSGVFFIGGLFCKHLPREYSLSQLGTPPQGIYLWHCRAGWNIAQFRYGVSFL